MARHFEKDFFKFKGNAEHRPPNWESRVEWNETETRIVLGEQQRKATSIEDSIRSSNKLAQSNAYSQFWSPLTGLVEYPADNAYYDFNHVLKKNWQPGNQAPKRNHHHPYRRTPSNG